MTFLSKKSQAYLNEMFNLRVVTKWKYRLEYMKAKNGADMLVIDFWKAPEYIDSTEDKSAYKTIKCYHIVQNYSNSKLSDGWYNGFSSCYTKEQLDQLFKYKGKWFVALVEHIEDVFNDNEYFKTEIVKVYKDGYDTDDINYLKLFKPLKK